MNQLPEAVTTWMYDDAVYRPYVYVRGENRIPHPGKRHHVEWFRFAPLYIDPLDLESQEFTELIYSLENRAFGPANMAMERWVFYDCAVVPGFVAGFAGKYDRLPDALKKTIQKPENSDWVPLSLFIIIPTMAKGEWVAHNLCSVNALLEKNDRLYGLGFLSKAFGLWYANVVKCCGMTQWGSPAIKLHSQYGLMEVMAAYTPVHSHASTITYRCQVNAASWKLFFSKKKNSGFYKKHEKTPYLIDPTNVQSQIALQTKLAQGEGPFFLSSDEVLSKRLTEPLNLYKIKGLR